MRKPFSEAQKALNLVMISPCLAMSVARMHMMTILRYSRYSASASPARKLVSGCRRSVKNMAQWWFSSGDASL